MVKPFVYEMLPGRVVFGDGRVTELPKELDRLGLSRVLVLATRRQLAAIAGFDPALDGRAVGTFDRIRRHVPDDLRREVLNEVERLDIDGAVAIGGGSATGLAKIIARDTGLPILAVPTTYSGSEMTPVWGLTEDGVKRTGRDQRVLPRTVIYDPELVAGLPPAVAGPSGMNAIAHCVEALYAENANPVTSIMAEEGIRALAAALPELISAPDSRQIAGEALYGAWLAGTVLATAGVALHHKLCHVVGGTFDLPHAETHAVILPHATAYNAPAASEAMVRIARALGAETAAGGLYDLAEKIGAPTSLELIGMPRDGLDRAADLALENPYYNPRPVDRDAIRELLENAYVGRRP
jgi:maleylacetate reductase